MRAVTSRPRPISSWANRNYRLLLLAPAAVLAALVAAYPLAYSIWVSFVNYDFRIPGHAWAAFQNYEDVIGDPIAVQAVWRTLLLSTAAVVIELVLGVLLALSLVRRFRGRAALMPLLILPLFLSPVVVGQIWAILLQRNGPVDSILDGVLGRDITINWTLEQPWNYLAIVFADVWQWTPFVFLILFAGLSAIPLDLYEAAGADGAGFRQAFFFLTLPLLLPFILLAAILRFLDAIKLFDVVFVLTQGGPGNETTTVALRLYEQGFRLFNIGYASAGSWLFLLLVGLGATLVLRRQLRSTFA